jgi:hypothetical protein
MHERNHGELQQDIEQFEERPTEVEDRPAARRRGRLAQMRSSRRARLAIVACLALWTAPPALAEPPPERDWTFAITPYIWLPAMTGDVTVRGRTADIDTSIADLFTESDFVFGLQAEMEAWYKKRFGMIFNGQWTVLDQDDNSFGPTDGPPFGPGIFPIEFDLHMNMGLFEFLGAYRVGAWELGSGPSSPAFTLEPFVGARVTTLKVTFDPEGGSDLDQSKTWADPILGSRMDLALGNEGRWKIRFRGDFGGFGAGSEFTWNLVGGLGYEWRFDTWQLEALLGGRALYQDFEDGSDLKRFEWDVTQYGPVVALGFKF